MDSFIQVDKSEWEAFLEDLSELERKYKLLLNKLDTDESRLDALRTSEKKEEVLKPYGGYRGARRWVGKPRVVFLVG